MQILKLPDAGKRVYGLDILRAVAILVVVFGHGKRLLEQHFDVSWMSHLILDGVTIFFVLSGFLIGQILIRNFEQQGATTKTLAQFWMRRWFRTLPNYFLILFMLLGIFHFVLGVDYERETEFFFFFQNFAWDHPYYFMEAWSLSVEEWFYLTTPILLFVINRLGFGVKNSFLIVAVIIILFSTGVRFYRDAREIVTNFTQLDDSIRKQVVTRLDSLMYGIVAAWLCHYYSEIFIRYRIHFLIAGLILSIGYKLSFMLIRTVTPGIFFYITVFSFSVFSSAVMFLLPFFYSIKIGKGWVYRILTNTSRVSYSMYLIHHSLILLLLIPLIKDHLTIPGDEIKSLIVYFLYWATTILGSVLLFKYWELPMMNLRDKIPIIPFRKVRNLIR